MSIEKALGIIDGSEEDPLPAIIETQENSKYGTLVTDTDDPEQIAELRRLVRDPSFAPIGDTSNRVINIKMGDSVRSPEDTYTVEELVERKDFARLRELVEVYKRFKIFRKHYDRWDRDLQDRYIWKEVQDRLINNPEKLKLVKTFKNPVMFGVGSDGELFFADNSDESIHKGETYQTAMRLLDEAGFTTSGGGLSHWKEHRHRPEIIRQFEDFTGKDFGVGKKGAGIWLYAHPFEEGEFDQVICYVKGGASNYSDTAFTTSKSMSRGVKPIVTI